MTRLEGQGALFDPTATAPRLTTAPRPGLPDHVRRRLEDAGVRDAAGYTRAVRLGTCRPCGAEVLRGLDGDVAAVQATADTVEVDVVGEALAIAARRMRWWLGRFSNAKKEPEWQLVPRLALNIANRSGPVFVEHRCNAPPPLAAPANRFVHPEQYRPRQFPIDPPF